MNKFLAFIFILFSINNLSAQCNIDNFTATIGGCDETSNHYTINGEVAYSNAPITGTLTVTVHNGGSTIADTIINLPASSPQNYSISNLLSVGVGLSITAAFSDSPSCESTINYTAPDTCICVTNIGSFTIENNSSTVTSPISLYLNETLTIQSNLDYTLPMEDVSSGTSYDPDLSFLIYGCQPTNSDPNFDPCLIGVLSNGANYSVTNNGNTIPNGTILTENDTVYIVPITMYNVSQSIYSVNNCFDMGNPIQVIFIDSVNSSGINNLSKINIETFPNPVSYKLNIGGLTTTTKIEIFNTTGKLVLSAQIEPNEQIDMTHLVSGTYILVISNSEVYGQKLLIKN